VGEAVHGREPNQALHYEFLCIQERLKPSNEAFEHVEVLKDDLWGFVQLIPARATYNVVVTDAFVQWYSCYGSSQFA